MASYQGSVEKLNNIGRDGRHRGHTTTITTTTITTTTTTATEKHRTQLTVTSCLERGGYGADVVRPVRNGLPKFDSSRGRGRGPLGSFRRCIEGSTISSGSRKSAVHFVEAAPPGAGDAVYQAEAAPAGGAPGTSRSSERKSSTWYQQERHQKERHEQEGHEQEPHEKEQRQQEAQRDTKRQHQRDTRHMLSRCMCPRTEIIQ